MAVATHDDGPPPFMRLVAHPVRWRLLRALAASDRRVSELSRLVGGRQSLVSYHLGRLRAEGMVSRRRSAADGRDSFYVLDLTRCGELLASSGAALHPGLRLAPRALKAPGVSAGAPMRVLFSCTGNSARSQIAEALARELGGGRLEAFSAGSHPKPLHPNAVRVMRERGIDLSGWSSKPLSVFAGQRFDYVVTLCDRVREVCPEFAGRPDVIHWSVPDPARDGGTSESTYPAFRRTAAELTVRITFLVDAIDDTRGVPSRSSAPEQHCGDEQPGA